MRKPSADYQLANHFIDTFLQVEKEHISTCIIRDVMKEVIPGVTRKQLGKIRGIIQKKRVLGELKINRDEQGNPIYYSGSRKKGMRKRNCSNSYSLRISLP